MIKFGLTANKSSINLNDDMLNAKKVKQSKYILMISEFALMKTRAPPLE